MVKPYLIQCRLAIIKRLNLTALVKDLPNDRLNKSSQMKINILVVEDNEISFRLAEYILTQSGYQVEWACNGKECLEKIKSTQYAGILMDVHMPELDGIEATKIIRQTHPKELLPIIGVTAEDTTTELDFLIQSGMNGHLSKPYQIETLLSKIQALVAECDSRPQILMKINSSTNTPETTELKWLNFKKILTQSQGDITLLKKITPLYSKTTQDLLSKIEQSLVKNKRTKLKHQLHQLKGVLSNFTTEGPFKTVVYLETLTRNNKMSELIALLPILKEEISVLQAYLEEQLSKS